MVLTYHAHASQEHIRGTARQRARFMVENTATTRYRRSVLPRIGFFIVVIAFVAGGQVCRAEAPPGYYSSLENKTGTEFRHALHLLIRGHTNLPYASSSFDTSDALGVLDEDPTNTNNVRLLYAQRSIAKSAFATAGGGGWNREHLWPNSYGLDDRAPAHSDLHNLRAEDETVNNERANKLFDFSDTNLASYRFPAHSEALLCSTDVDSWAPPASMRGDIARALFYMDVRYEGSTNGEPNLVLTDNLPLINGTVAFMGRLTTLLKWHASDPVDAPERKRNDLIFDRYQHNRNPFVDRPEWVAKVFAPVLTAAHTGVVSVLAWTWNHTNVRVEYADAINSDWSNAPGIPMMVNGRWQLSVARSAANRYFRLRCE